MGCASFSQMLDIHIIECSDCANEAEQLNLAHTVLKRVAFNECVRRGFQTELEKLVRTPEVKYWKRVIADVLVFNDQTSRIAIEIQWKSDKYAISRQEKYDRAGVESYWLLRQIPGELSGIRNWFKISENLQQAAVDTRQAVGEILEKRFPQQVPLFVF